MTEESGKFQARAGDFSVSRLALGGSFPRIKVTGT
jgi:hypothetical protein